MLDKVTATRKCICCDLEIEEIERGINSKPWESMWRGGVVTKIAAGFGSIVDGNVYFMAICDGCIKAKVDSGVLEYSYNYLVSSENS